MLLGSLFKWGRQPLSPLSPVPQSAQEFVSGLDESSSHGTPVAKLLRDRRYAALLRGDLHVSLDASIVETAWKTLEEEMALIPTGQITLVGPDSPDNELATAIVPASTVAVPAFYLNRCAVTNADYARFVAANGYDQMGLWPQEIWPSVVQFVDQTGHPGPRFWSNGRPPRGRDDHPVVGVSWYEASTYANWLGKRLPRGAEWEKAASWPADLSGHGPQTRYPWGNAFDRSRANTWGSARGDTVPVREYNEGCTPNGIYQLIGNVWEWVADAFTGPPCPRGYRVVLDQPMGEVRGAAFDTYFEIQATCRFSSGMPLLSRAANVGFRCAVGAEEFQARLTS